MSALRAIVIGSLLLAAGPAAAQGLPGGRPPDAIDRARGLATQPFGTLPAPGAARRDATCRQRRVYSPAQGREVLVPGHYERDVNGQRVEVPPLVTTTPDGRNPVVVPGGERPRARAARRPLMLEAVGMAEINKIFAVTDALGVHREALVIPLGTGKGRVRKLPSGKFEITVDAETPLDEWLEGLPALIRAAMA